MKKEKITKKDTPHKRSFLLFSGGILSIITGILLCPCSYAVIIGSLGLGTLTAGIITGGKYLLIILGITLMVIGIMFQGRKKTCNLK